MAERVEGNCLDKTAPVVPVSRTCERVETLQACRCVHHNVADSQVIFEKVEPIEAVLQPVSLVEADDYICDIITKIATLMKPETEKKLGKSFAIFNPVYYMKKGSISYCLRIEVDGGQLVDVTGKYAAGAVSKIKAKDVTKEDEMIFW